MQRSPILDYFRHILAFIVILAHTYAQTGEPEPWAFGTWPGILAVYGFFILSGQLVTLSYRRHPRRFLMRRAARLVPAAGAAIVLGWLLSWLCGGFASNPWPAVNASLWTIPYECACYALVLLTRGRVWSVAPLALLLPSYAAPLVLCFVIGSLLPSPPPLKLPPLPFDYSYGMYVYAFPVAQTIMSLFHPARGMLGLLTLACLVPLCALSWRSLEKPALQFSASASLYPRAAPTTTSTATCAIRAAGTPARITSTAVCDTRPAAASLDTTTSTGA